MNITRPALTWLLISGSVLIVPQMLYLPIWVLVLWIVCACWRWQAFKMRVNLPNTPIKLLISFGVLCAIFFTNRSLLGLDAAASFVVSLFAVKLLELNTKRDAWVLILLGFILLTVAFLFEDGFLAAIYSLLPFSVLLAAAIGLHQSEKTSQNIWATWRLAAKMLLQTAPLMIILFVIFPRLDPLWNVPQSAGKTAETGLSDTMNPADLVEITNSGAKTFKVIFADNILPPKKQLYWRAMTYENYSGREWQQMRSYISIRDNIRIKGKMLDYQVIMEPHYKHWLFSIAPGFTYDENIRMSGDFRLYRVSPVTQIFQYNVLSYPDALREPNIHPHRLKQNLQLPKKGNPKTRNFAQNLAQTYENSEDIVNAIIKHLRQNGFKYSLQPGLLAQDNIDDFFFNTKNGFCAHYAEAMTFILRAAGVPARVVAGYQGGDWNKSGNFLQVRQSDAHAWVEYWVQDLGWQQIDPTFAIAPNRINLGLTDALAGNEASIAQTLRELGENNLIKSFTDKWDALNHQWQIKILSYQSERQMELFTEFWADINIYLLFKISIYSALVLMIICGVLIIKPWQYRLVAQTRVVKRFDEVLKQKLGIIRTNDESITTCARRGAKAAKNEQSKQDLLKFAQEFEDLTYAQNLPPNSAKYRRLKTYLKQIK